MQQEKKQEIALMRYTAIAPLIIGLGDEYPSQSSFYRMISEKGIMGPNGKTRHYSPDTFEKWYLLYTKYGFEGLMPGDRSDVGKSRSLDAELQEHIRYLKANYPRMSAAAGSFVVYCSFMRFS